MKTLFAALMLIASTCYGQGIPVLMYHNITDVGAKVGPDSMHIPQKDFENEMAWLHDNGYATITVSQLATYMLDPTTTKLPSDKVVVITFDDGWASQLNVIPTLQKYNFTATFNIITSKPDQPAKVGYMNWDQIKQLADTGFEIADHTASHNDNEDHDIHQDLDVEIVQSKAVLEQHIQKSVTSIAWPYGHFSKEMVVKAMKAGYDNAQTVDQDDCQYNDRGYSGAIRCNDFAGNFAEQNPFLIKRIQVDGRYSIAQFQQVVTEEHTVDVE